MSGLTKKLVFFGATVMGAVVALKLMKCNKDESKDDYTYGNDVRHPNRKKILLLFDIDGTLSASRLQMKENMYKLLCKARKKVYIGTVGGSDFPKAQEQLGGSKYGDITKFFDYVFAENGLVAYGDGKKLNDHGIKQELSNDEIKEFVNFCLQYIGELELPIKRGTFVEFRTGMINVCPIGRNCSQQERIEFYEYDKKHLIRETMIKAIKKGLPQLTKKLTMSIGGQISFDVFPNGWDKRYCLQFLNDKTTNKCLYEKIYFFGDKTYKGGNDYEIFEDPRTIGTTVKSPDDTIKYVNKILDELD